MEKTKLFYKKLYLVVEVAIGVNGTDELIGDDELKTALEHDLNACDDGRQIFSVEIFKDGLRRMVEGGLARAVYNDADRRFPNKRTLDGTSFSCKLADFKMKKLSSVFVSHTVEVLALKPVE